MDIQNFITTIQKGYTFKGACSQIGVAMLNEQAIAEAPVYLPTSTMNRHGLIAGATGTGKTKTLQMLSEILSDHSIPVLLMDIKGDLSGIAAQGSINEKITERYQTLHLPFTPTAYPVELLSLSNEKGTKLRATVSEFGPILLSKILELNSTQAGIVSILFKYCDDHQLPLIDLKDFIKLLQYVSQEGKESLETNYGKIATTSIGTILRKVVELQQQGADILFAEPSFEVNDLMRISNDGRGMVNILRVTDLQDRPKIFSTFILQILDELYASLPEEGDMEQPKLVIFIDEAHLLFNEASHALLEKIETIIKLIRSKGVGIFFCTQNPQDIPASILSQLGLKIQHALRAFTAADRKTIKTAAENFPITPYYDTKELLTQMGIGEALISVLNEKGIPTPLVHTLLCSPKSRMNILTDNEIEHLVAHSHLKAKYTQQIDRESAYEILSQKLQTATTTIPPTTNNSKKESSILEHTLVKSAIRTATTIVAGYITRSLLGTLGLGRKPKR